MPGYQKWGLGVRVITDEAYQNLSVGSFGWSGAYGSHFWIDPKNDICAVFMKNSRFDGGEGNGSANRFEEAVFNALIY
jgi:CubicO group peptidase (beta-lactamase class C family)